MSKERLEEIKQLLCEIEVKIEEGKREDAETINEKIIDLYLNNHIDWLIEQAEKMIKVREIYENGGEAWQDDAEDVIFDRGEANE